MIIENIAKKKQELKIDLKKNLKSWSFYMLLSMCSVVLGSVMFFYVEECYFLVQPAKLISQRCQEVCEDVVLLNTSIIHNGTLNNHSAEISSMLLPVNQSQNVNSSVPEIIGRLLKNCQEKNCFENFEDKLENCDYDFQSFSKWMYYSWVVVHTIGKHCIKRISRYIAHVDKALR